MGEGGEKFEKLKHYLRHINTAKKRKRVGDLRLQAKQYAAHVIPILAQRLAFAPYYRACMASQISELKLMNALEVANKRPLHFLKASNRKLGYMASWRGVTSHLISASLFPGVLLSSRHFNGTNPEGGFFTRYYQSLLICASGLALSYPHDVAHTRLALNLGKSIGIGEYFKKTVTKAGKRIDAIKQLYSGYSICMLSSCIHLWSAFAMDDYSMKRMKRYLDMELTENPLIKWEGDVHKFPPQELKPVVFYPWNVLYGSAAAFAAKALTYPLDTLRVKYQYDSWNYYQKPGSLSDSFRDVMKRGIPRMYRGFGLKSALVVPECLLYGLVYSFVVKTTC